MGSGGSNSDSGKYYFCAGTEASVTLNTTHSVTYYYKGENGKTIVSGTVTFTSTTSQAVVTSSSMSAVNANSNIKLPNEN